MLLVRSATRVVLATLLLVGCSSATPAENARSTRDAVSSTEGDWSLLGGGQCLVSMQSFYSARFGVRVPTARNSYTGSCAEEGACHIWYDDRPDPALWTRVPNDGSASPSLYDLVVFAETSTNPYGHIASVDHVEGGTIYVMDSNYNGDEKRSASPHSVRAPLGWYHLVALGGGGGNASGGNTSGGGETCGDRASRLGWRSAACEQASSSSESSRVACNGTGGASSDCSRCCDADAVGPSHTDESCGVYAARMGFASPLCESETSGSCQGSGPSTADCMHCCDSR